MFNFALVGNMHYARGAVSEEVASIPFDATCLISFSDY